MIRVDFSYHPFVDSTLNEENLINNLIKSKNSYIAFKSLIKRDMEKLLPKISIEKILVFSGCTYIKLSTKKDSESFKIKKYFKADSPVRRDIKYYYSKTYDTVDLFQKYHEIFEVVNYQNYPIENIEENFSNIRGFYLLRGVRSKEKEKIS